MNRNKMNITISELKGNSLKKDLDLDRAFFRWHNKNKTWGNFGINLITKKEGLDKKDFELRGNYKKPNGEIYKLRFAKLYSIGESMPSNLTYKELIDLLIEKLKSSCCLNNERELMRVEK